MNAGSPDSRTPASTAKTSGSLVELKVGRQVGSVGSTIVNFPSRHSSRITHPDSGSM